MIALVHAEVLQPGGRTPDLGQHVRVGPLAAVGKDGERRIRPFSRVIVKDVANHTLIGGWQS